MINIIRVYLLHKCNEKNCWSFHYRLRHVVCDNRESLSLINYPFAIVCIRGIRFSIRPVFRFTRRVKETNYWISKAPVAARRNNHTWQTHSIETTTTTTTTNFAINFSSHYRARITRSESNARGVAGKTNNRYGISRTFSDRCVY